jgi:glycosyltransferase involved in cell wall biosynthesis
MKILFVSPFSSAPTLMNRTLPLLRGLDQLGYEVDAFLPYHDRLVTSGSYPGPESISNKPRAKHKFIQATEDTFKWLAHPGFGKVFFPLAGIDEFRVFFQGALRFASIEGDYDAIYASKPWLRSAGLGLWLGRKWRIPVVIDMDDYDISEGSYLLPRFRGVVVSSHELGRLFKSYSPLYLPNSTDLAIFDPKRFTRRRINECIVVWSGIMYDYIKLENLIIASSKMREDALILFSGDGPKKPELIRLAKSLGVDNKILFSEWGKRSVVLERLANADIGIVYSSNTTFERCKCPGKLFEYMSMKLPVVTTNVGEAAATVREAGCGLEVPPDDPDSLASTLDYLVRNPAIRRKMGENGRSYLLMKQSYSILAARLAEYLARVVLKSSIDSN